MKKQLLMASCLLMQLCAMEMEIKKPGARVRNSIRRLKKKYELADGSLRFACKIALGDFKTACSRDDYIIRCEYSKQILKNHGLLTKDEKIDERIKTIALSYFNRTK